MAKVCKRRVKCTGLKSNGRLKKGYKFQKGTGRVVKSNKSN